MKLYDLAYYFFIGIFFLILVEYIFVLFSIPSLGLYLIIIGLIYSISSILGAIIELLVPLLPMAMFYIHIFRTRSGRRYSEDALNQFAIWGIFSIISNLFFNFIFLTSNNTSSLGLSFLIGIVLQLLLIFYVLKMQYGILQQFRLWYILGLLTNLVARMFILPPPGDGLSTLELVFSIISLLLDVPVHYYLWKFLGQEQLEEPYSPKTTGF